jgi:hypothetical protein
MTTTKLLSAISLVLAMGGIGSAVFLSGTGQQASANSSFQKMDEPPLKEGALPDKDAKAFGPKVKGLRAKVSVPQGRFAVGEAMPVKYVVKNVSQEEQTLWHRGFWPNHVIVVKDAEGKERSLTEFGSQCRKAFAPNRRHDKDTPEGGKSVPVKVPPGGEDSAYEQYDLTKLFDLSRPGRYTVQYLYDERQREGGWEGRLPSNVTVFDIVARGPKGRDSRVESKPVRVAGLEFYRRTCSKVGIEQPFESSAGIDLHGIRRELGIGGQAARLARAPCPRMLGDGDGICFSGNGETNTASICRGHGMSSASGSAGRGLLDCVHNRRLVV